MKKLLLFTLLITMMVGSYAQALSVLKDIKPGKASSYAGDLIRAENKLFFEADDSTHGAELWASNGTSNGTSMILDLNPGTPASFPQNLMYMNGALYFTANDGTSGKELWKLDLSTKVALKLTTTAESSPFGLENGFIIYNNNLYFSFNDGIHGAEVWKTDGTVTGTMLVKDLKRGIFSTSPRDFFIYKSKLFYRGNDTTDTQAMYVIDAATGTNERVYNCGEGGCFAFTNFKDSIYFFSDNHIFSNPDMELYVSDGTTAGTHIVKQINPNGPGTYFGMVATNNLLFFSADDGVHGIELWKSDGSTNGTKMVVDLAPGSKNSTPSDLIVYNNKVIYQAYQDAGGAWISDGTAAGTLYLGNILVNNDGDNHIKIANQLFFVGYIPNYGYELCVSDGTPVGTKLAMDIYKGIAPSYPDMFTPLGNSVFFQATNYSNGTEIFSLTDPSNSSVNFATASDAVGINSTDKKVWLQQNSPNPTTGVTAVQYILPASYKDASIVFTSPAGQIIKTIPLSGSGPGNISVNTKLFSPGNYLYSLVVDGKIIATKNCLIQ